MSSDRAPLAEYLRARREQVQPEDVGLPRDEGRRVPGLRREEVATLAGISPEYYLRLEQGRDHQPSDQVLRALARALDLDDDGLSYLLRLSRPWPLVRRFPAPPAAVGEGVLRLLDQLAGTPAYVIDRNHDILAANTLARALAPGFLEPRTNLVVSTFEAAARAIASPTTDEGELAEWRSGCEDLVAALRFSGDAGDPRFQEVVGTLSLAHRSFRTIWARHEARAQSSGEVGAHIDPIGWVLFRWQRLEVPGASGHVLTTLFADPGTPAEAALAYLSDRVAAQDALGVAPDRLISASSLRREA
ncbi:MAG: helix-turn-helix transcriptional regulator [Herbiconiux sp.]|nr:helix-turn-helix transcriptional regulator [Herbiconiux sp.]